MKIVSGTNNPKLSKEIAKYLKTKIVNSSIRRFADSEVYIEINENMMSKNLFFLESYLTRIQILPLLNVFLES